MNSTDRAVLDTLGRIRERISENITQKGLRASGKTQESMRVEETEHGGRLVGRRYFQSLEEGSAPAPRGAWFRDVIKRWIIDKGISVSRDGYRSDEAALNSAAFLISRSIQRFGTITFQQGGRSDIYSDVITQEVAELRKTLAVTVRQSLVGELSGGGHNFSVKSTER